MEADRSLEDLDAGPPTVQTHEAAVAGFAAASSAQRMAALEKAYVAKREGGLVRRLIAGRKVDPIHTIAGTLGDLAGFDPEAAERIEKVLQSWSVERLLNAVPGIGPSKRHQIIESFGLSPGTKIRDLTYEQRGVLSRLTRAARTPCAVDL
jgi:hypothetical protein